MTLYGYDRTIHGTQKLDVERTADGDVVSVWFRCLALPFDVTIVDKQRAEEMRSLSSDVNARVKLLAVDYTEHYYTKDRDKTSCDISYGTLKTKPVHNHLGGGYRGGCPACDLIQIPNAHPTDDVGEQKAVESAWLIECVKTGEPIAAWVTIKHGLFYLTVDSTEAIRFARKEDAELMMKCNILYGQGELVATEHSWS